MPQRNGPAPGLVPELTCRNLEISRRFYVDVIGFRVLYERPEDRFVYLEREGVELMLDQLSPASWLTAETSVPFGRGLNLQITVSDVDALHARVEAAGIALFRPMEEAWYRAESYHLGNRQFLVQDPDGYLLRFFQDLGRRDGLPRDYKRGPMPVA
jgi:catechol 2,3-dioxygenase-like lactoylglutathione lyase family enzyme